MLFICEYIIHILYIYLIYIYIYIYILSSHKKEWDSAICNDLDEPWGHYVKWSKSDIKRQVPYNSNYMES